MTAGARRLSIMLLTAMVLAGGLFNIHTLAVGPGVSFSFLQLGFTQELIGVTNNLLTGDVDGDDVPDGILGGVAFDPHGNPMVAECEFQGTRLHVFDLQSSPPPVHDNDLSSETILNSQGGCGLVNHPDGYLYVAMNDGTNGIAKISRATGAFLAFMGPPGNSLGIAVDPQVNQSGTHDLVYAAADCRFTDGCTYIRLNPADGTHSVFGHLDGEDADFTDGMYFDPTGNYLFIANRSPELRMTVLNRAGQLVQHVAMESEPDGIAFHATAPKFVVTNNTDGTMTRFNFPGDDYTQLPTSVDVFASGGYRGDLSQVGEDGCIYLTQKGVHYNDLISTTDFDPDNSVVRICGGFAPPPGVEHEEDNTGSITGTIFQDTNHNGVQDAGEPGIPGVTVTITDQNGNPVVPPGPNTDTTDASGNFDFPGLPPGTFTITVTPPEGLSSENPQTQVTVDSGSTTPVVTNFPLVAGSIAGFAYVDLNGDGFKNAGEPGIPNVSIGLAGGPGGSAMTGADGGYFFGDLPGASYNVSAPASAAGKTRSTTSPLAVVLSAGQNATDVNFGYVPGGLSGFAYVDLNANGVKDGGEPGIDGVTISLSGVSSATTTTSGGGAYSFAGLDAGGFSVSAPSTADGKSLATASSLNVTLAEGEHSPDHNFGYVPGEISGFAYVDANRNNAKDGGEPGIGGISITLSGQASDSRTTAADGSYSFTSLDGGSYNAGAPSVADGKALATASPLTVALAAGEERDHVDFGYVPGGLSGFAYLDTDHNSLKDAGEPGIAGVTIALAGGGTIVTAADGSYAFSSLNAGDYSVMAPASAGATTLFTMSPLSVTLAAGQTQPNVNFGYVSPNPGASLTKTASPTTYDTAGQVIVYTYVIQNTGDVTLSGPFTITDDKLGSFQCGAATSLAPGTSLSCTRSYTIQASDLGSAPNLPTGVTTNINTGAWLQGVMSTQDTTISGAAPGLPNGIYPGWCIQDHVNVDLHDQPGTLYSTIGGNLPADVASLSWGKVNYVLNHKIRGAGKSDLAFFKDVQTAVWVSLGEPNPEFGISADAQQMIDAANAHANYVPGYGEVVAVIIYSDGMGTNPNTIQESIIEVKPYQSITNHATATASAGQVAIQTGQVQATVSQVPAPAPPPVPTAPMDAVAWGHRPSAATTVTTSVFSTTAGSELLLAFVSADGPSPGTNSVTGVSGAGLTWQLVKRSNVQLGTAEIWRAFAPGTLSNVSVTATLSKSAASSLTVVSMTGVDTSGTNGSGAIGATASNNGSTGAPTISLTTTRANSWIFGVGNDWDNPIARTVGANQAMVHQYMPPVGDTFWVQQNHQSDSVERYRRDARRHGSIDRSMELCRRRNSATGPAAADGLGA